MRFEGYTKKVGKFWHVEIPILGLASQGKTESDAHDMILDALEMALDDKSARLEVFPGENNTFTVRSSKPREFIAFMLRQQRAEAGLTLEQVAKRLRVNSTNAYARYEQGRSVPTLEKLIELIHAVSPEKDPVLKIAG